MKCIMPHNVQATENMSRSEREEELEERLGFDGVDPYYNPRDGSPSKEAIELLTDSYTIAHFDNNTERSQFTGYDLKGMVVVVDGLTVVLEYRVYHTYNQNRQQVTVDNVTIQGPMD